MHLLLVQLLQAICIQSLLSLLVRVSCDNKFDSLFKARIEKQYRTACIASSLFYYISNGKDKFVSYYSMFTGFS